METKKIITIAIVVLVALGIGFYLFKISSQPASSYNSALRLSGASQISQPPAFDPSTDHYMGNPNAKNVFIEYADLQCPACAAYKDILKEVTSQFPDTVFVFRHFPLVQAHINTVQAALAAEAANAQGKFWEFEEIMFNRQSEWQNLADPLENFAQYAQQAGVSNIEQFKNDITSKKYLDLVQRHTDQALGLNLTGTPSLFINGKPLKTGGGLDALKAQAEPFLNK